MEMRQYNIPIQYKNVSGNKGIFSFGLIPGYLIIEGFPGQSEKRQFGCLISWNYNI
jgi:hypothetical protein